MSTLNLIIQKKFAIEILQKTKTREYRDFSDFYISRFFDTKKEKTKNTIVLNIKGKEHFFTPRKFEKIRFQIGYSKKFLIAECGGWGMFTKKTCREYVPEAVNRSLSEDQARYKGEGPRLLDVVQEEFDIEYMLENDPFFIFSIGNVLEDKSELNY